MTDIGQLTTFLGLEIKRNRTNRTLFLSQIKYVNKILETFGMQRCNPAATPVDPYIRLEKSNPEYDATAADRLRYQSAVGSLMYAMLGTHPDIAYAVAKVCQFSTNPNMTHWTAVKRIF